MRKKKKKLDKTTKKTMNDSEKKIYTIKTNGKSFSSLLTANYIILKE